MNIFLKLAIVIAFGVIGGKAAKALNLPNVTGYLLAGLLLGPSFIHLVTEADGEMISFVNEVALGIIAFSIGGEFAIEDLKRVGKEVLIITLAEVIGVVLIVFVGMYFVLQQDFVFSLMIASMSAATAPAGTVMVIRQYRAYGPLTQMILPVAALDDAFGIMVFGVALSIAKLTTGTQAVSLSAMILSPLWEIVGSMLLGGVLGFIFAQIIKRVKSRDGMLSAILSVILFGTGLAYWTGLSALLTNMVIGAMVVNLVRNSKQVYATIDEFAPPINLFFFVFAGAGLDLSILSTIGGLGIVYALSRGLGKTLGATAGAYLAKSEDVIKKWLGLALLPQGGISIGLSMIVARELPAYADQIITVILFSVLVFEIAGPILAKVSITKAGEVNGLDRIQGSAE